ncbi:hypothetical protein [Salinarchaeum chitinilyticum]
MAAKEHPRDAPGMAHPTVVPTNAEHEEECPECGTRMDDEE